MKYQILLCSSFMVIKVSWEIWMNAKWPTVPLGKFQWECFMTEFFSWTIWMKWKQVAFTTQTKCRGKKRFCVGVIFEIEWAAPSFGNSTHWPRLLVYLTWFHTKACQCMKYFEFILTQKWVTCFYGCPMKTWFLLERMNKISKHIFWLNDWKCISQFIVCIDSNLFLAFVYNYVTYESFDL